MDKEVIIDTREPKHVLDIATKTLKDYKVKRAKLEVGDIQFEDIIVERKTPSDFVTSARRSDFWTNLYVMKTNYKHSFLLIDGDDFSWREVISRRGITNSMVEGAKVSVLMMGIPIIEFAKLSSAFKYLDVMFQKKVSVKPPRTADLKISKLNANLHSLRIASLMCVPRIGNVTAEKLLQEYGTLMSVIEEAKNADTPAKKRIYDFFYGKDKDNQNENPKQNLGTN